METQCVASRLRKRCVPNLEQMIDQKIAKKGRRQAAIDVEMISMAKKKNRSKQINSSKQAKMPIPICTDTLMDVFCWLDHRAEHIQRLVLVSRRFRDIAQRNWNTKCMMMQKRRCPDLEFFRVCYRHSGVRIPGFWQELAIPEMLPPQHLLPPSEIIVHYIDDRVLNFFRTIAERWLQDVLLNFVNVLYRMPNMLC